MTEKWERRGRGDEDVGAPHAVHRAGLGVRGRGGAGGGGWERVFEPGGDLRGVDVAGFFDKGVAGGDDSVGKVARRLFALWWAEHDPGTVHVGVGPYVAARDVVDVANECE